MSKILITPDDIHWFEPVFRAWECNDMPGVLESLESAIKQFIPNRDHGCDCSSCRVRHASDCAVHNMPAMPNGPCDCGILDDGAKSHE